MTANRCSIGVDLGGTNLRIAAYSEDPVAGTGLTESVSLPTRVADGPDAVAGDITARASNDHAQFALVIGAL